MAEISESEGEEAEELTLRDQLVSSEGVTNFDYSVGSLEVPESSTTCAIIAVALVDSKLLVCVPEAAWSKKKARRGIMPDALSKAVAVHVPTTSQTDRQNADLAVTMKVWLGLLKEDYEAQVTFGEAAVSCDLDFLMSSTGLRLPPFARALVAVANDHFTFVTAESTLGGDLVGGPPGLVPTMSDRMLALEEMMSEIKQSLTSGQVRAAKPRPSALKARPKGAATPADLQGLGLDAGVTASALQAGVTPDALAEMAGVLANQPQQLSFAEKPVTIATEESSEDEVEAAGLGTTAASGLQDPVAQAVIQLTRIVGKMDKAKKAAKDRGLEAILDRAESGSSKEIGGGGASRSKAAALRSLQKLLTTNPQLIYQALEERMQEDWRLASPAPGTSSSNISARGWVEHRSRIQPYANSIRASWIIAGIWDSLIAGRTSEARARTALGLAMIDQQSVDAGSWLVAGEISLEPAPPQHAFQNHVPPGPWEAQHTRLIDDRFYDLIIAKLRDLADFQEKRSKLQAPRPPRPTDPPRPDPKIKADPKRNAKGGGKKGGQRDEDAPAAAAQS